ncbi:MULTISPECIES: hypothetical protein [Pseudomonas]|uniref:Uncharacterized protein n=1 Tax=Pseudomonas fluorescens TaxID=294 RepID=A0A161ZF77_PSEFL|nr:MULTISPECIES: hypothetical protein [Pseudomonas]KZN20532.1 hypothetical protein A1D17_03040 [Pseudomonas fluorescens]
MTTKIETAALASVCQVQKLFIHEYELNGVRRQLPVVTEYALTYQDDHKSKKNTEFYRARAYRLDGDQSTDFHRYDNTICVTICHKSQSVMFGPTGVIKMNPRGAGIGPALMANVIEWLQRQPGTASYAVMTGMLDSNNAKTDDERLQRNKFYMAFGFTLSSMTDAEGLDVVGGHFTAPSVGLLSVPERYQSRMKPWGAFDTEVGKERSEAAQVREAAAENVKTLQQAREWYEAGIFRRPKWPL